MRVSKIVEITNARVICCEDKLDTEILSACGCDLMSDVLAFVKDQGMLITGLVNPQSIRTAEMMDMVCILFVRGKVPDEAMINLARSKGMILLSCNERLYSACGKLYSAGLDAGEKI